MSNTVTKTITVPSDHPCAGWTSDQIAFWCTFYAPMLGLVRNQIGKTHAQQKLDNKYVFLLLFILMTGDTPHIDDLDTGFAKMYKTDLNKVMLFYGLLPASLSESISPIVFTWKSRLWCNPDSDKYKDIKVVAAQHVADVFPLVDEKVTEISGSYATTG